MTINYFCAFFLVIIGILIIINKRNLIKIVIGMCIIDYGINLLLISIGYSKGGTVPIFSDGVTVNSILVDPVPQALTLTSIVIGACVTALSLATIIKIKEYYNSIDSDKVRRIKG